MSSSTFNLDCSEFVCYSTLHFRILLSVNALDAHKIFSIWYNTYRTRWWTSPVSLKVYPAAQVTICQEMLAFFCSHWTGTYLQLCSYRTPFQQAQHGLIRPGCVANYLGPSWDISSWFRAFNYYVLQPAMLLFLKSGAVLSQRFLALRAKRRCSQPPSSALSGRIRAPFIRFFFLSGNIKFRWQISRTMQSEM